MRERERDRRCARELLPPLRRLSRSLDLERDLDLDRERDLRRREEEEDDDDASCFVRLSRLECDDGFSRGDLFLEEPSISCCFPALLYNFTQKTARGEGGGGTEKAMRTLVSENLGAPCQLQTSTTDREAATTKQLQESVAILLCQGLRVLFVV